MDKDTIRRGGYPRGHFYKIPSWTKDNEVDYFPTMKSWVIWPFIKLLLLYCLAKLITKLGFNKIWTSSVLFIIVALYQRIVAYVMGYEYMHPMDQACFISSKFSKVNLCGASGIEGTLFDQKSSKKLTEKIIKRFEKSRYKIEYFCGDLYYKKMSIQETLEKAYKWLDEKEGLKNMSEVDCWVEDNINMKLPLDGPQWRLQF